MIFQSPKFGRFRVSCPSNSEEWSELACDVIEGLTMFCSWGKCMRRCDSVIQKCVVGGRGAAQKAQERDVLFLRYLYLDSTRPETRKRRQKYAGLCEVGPKQGQLSSSSWISGSPLLWKPRDFHGLYIILYLLVQSSTLSGYKRSEFWISWEPSDCSIKTSPKVADQNND